MMLDVVQRPIQSGVYRVNIKTIIIPVAAGAVSFVGAFTLSWLTRPAPPEPPAAENPSGAAQGLRPGEAPLHVLAPALSSGDTGTRAMTEQQLKDLVAELRLKMQEYDEKLQVVEKDRERLQMAQQGLKKDIETLNNLRVDIATTAAGVKTERDMLLKTRVEVEKTEKANLTAIAAAYDKMDATRASEILRSMAVGPKGSGATAKNVNEDDAIKILHFMQDRTKAKVLAEMAATEPTLAANLCQKLKQVTETK
jgi:flagellar motility protein MotE (MotC chaperone)